MFFKVIRWFLSWVFLFQNNKQQITNNNLWVKLWITQIFLKAFWRFQSTYQVFCLKKSKIFSFVFFLLFCKISYDFWWCRMECFDIYDFIRFLMISYDFICFSKIWFVVIAYDVMWLFMLSYDFKWNRMTSYDALWFHMIYNYSFLFLPNLITTFYY